ncbi:unnamed protein product [Acanthosepion pharaonis]|uniref:Uncharacterized protein n=1 Tax=Acanthosepion pharaonis TaxID=158019 RepID=A0A812ESJ9_ACAPH|nr:unnamed protein product [Sepia pharaonis]
MFQASLSSFKGVQKRFPRHFYQASPPVSSVQKRFLVISIKCVQASLSSFKSPIKCSGFLSFVISFLSSVFRLHLQFPRQVQVCPGFLVISIKFFFVSIFKCPKVFPRHFIRASLSSFKSPKVSCHFYQVISPSRVQKRFLVIPIKCVQASLSSFKCQESSKAGFTLRQKALPSESKSVSFVISSSSSSSVQKRFLVIFKFHFSVSSVQKRFLVISIKFIQASLSSSFKCPKVSSFLVIFLSSFIFHQKFVFIKFVQAQFQVSKRVISINCVQFHSPVSSVQKRFLVIFIYQVCSGFTLQFHVSKSVSSSFLSPVSLSSSRCVQKRFLVISIKFVQASHSSCKCPKAFPRHFYQASLSSFKCQKRFLVISINFIQASLSSFKCPKAFPRHFYRCVQVSLSSFKCVPRHFIKCFRLHSPVSSVQSVSSSFLSRLHLQLPKNSQFPSSSFLSSVFRLQLSFKCPKSVSSSFLSSCSGFTLQFQVSKNVSSSFSIKCVQASLSSFKVSKSVSRHFYQLCSASLLSSVKSVSVISIKCFRLPVSSVQKRFFVISIKCVQASHQKRLLSFYQVCSKKSVFLSFLPLQFQVPRHFYQFYSGFTLSFKCPKAFPRHFYQVCRLQVCFSVQKRFLVILSIFKCPKASKSSSSFLSSVFRLHSPVSSVKKRLLVISINFIQASLSSFKCPKAFPRHFYQYMLSLSLSLS